MVEISKYGSGEGHPWETRGAYSTGDDSLFAWTTAPKSQIYRLQNSGVRTMMTE